MHRFIIPVFFLFSPVVIAAAVYRWVDDEGRIHYSDTYTPGARPVDVSVGAPDAQQAAEHRARQQTLRQVVTQQAKRRRSMESRREQIARRIGSGRLQQQQTCLNLQKQLDSLQASWEIKRRRGYQAADKRKFTARRAGLRQQLSDSCG